MSFCCGINVINRIKPEGKFRWLCQRPRPFFKLLLQTSCKEEKTETEHPRIPGPDMGIPESIDNY